VSLLSFPVFTQEAINFAVDKPIDLVNGAQLEQLITNIQSPTHRIVPSLQTDIKAGAINDPICPKCGSQLVVRFAMKGANTGNQFLGCSTFPKCRYTESFDTLISH